MRNRIERLRVWLLAATGLLLAVLAIFIGSARYVKRHFLARLPSRLGVDVKSETNGFTYSQSVQGRTIFTVHAAREIEHSSGTITLHDVWMVLYGKTGNRADRIEGSQFEYDQNAGVLRAVGQVHMDLGASREAVTGRGSDLSSEEFEKDPKLLHATTSGLVYLQKLGIAATSEAIDFQTGQMKGHAIGADYNTDSGTLLLHAAVKIDGVANGRPADLTASTAEVEERGQRVLLTGARYVAGAQAMDADRALIYTRPDNTIQRIDATGDVRLGSQGATVSAARADVALGAKNTPESAVLTGGVRYVDDGPLRQAHGQADGTTVRFDSEGAPVDAVFTGSVEMTERTRRTGDATQPWDVRTLTANSVHTTMVAVSKGRSALRTADAVGGARLEMVDSGSRPSPRAQQTTELAGDGLMARLVPPTGPAGQSRLESVTAQGHTRLRQMTARGVEQTSSGDSLLAIFRPAAPGERSQPARLSSGAVELASAVQTGHVVMTRQAPAVATRPGQPMAAPEVQRATAQRSVYDADTDRVQLTGGVELAESDSVLWASQVQFDRGTGDAQAQGAVKVSYTNSAAGANAAASNPIHVLADRAQLVHATEVATFFGRPARLWQGGSQVQAPVLELARTTRELTARPGANGVGEVLSILVGASPSPGGGAAAADAAATASPGRAERERGPDQPRGIAPPGAPRVVRVVSRGLVYSDAEREARFTGGVVMTSDGETIHSRTATAYLAPSGAAGMPAASPSGASPAVGASGTTPAAGASAGQMALDGRLERVIASTDVIVQEPGRRATGDRLSYTAADGTVVLTGTAKTPPVVVDTAQGSRISAAAFRFRNDGETVEALSAAPEGAFERQVRTQTTVRKR